MFWDTWGPALLSSAAAATVGGWIVKAFIESGVKHGFERQIEELKSGLRESENELSSMRSTMLGRIAASNQELDKRRLKALETLWSAIMFQRRFGTAIAFAKIMNLDAVDEAIREGGRNAEGIAKMAEVIWSVQGFEKAQENPLADISSERLFVPPQSWLAYQAILSLAGRATATLAAIKTGVAPNGLIKGPDDINEMIVAVLPHTAEYLKSFPDVGGYYLISQLEEIAFSQIVSAMSGDAHDDEMTQRVAKVLRHTRDMEQQSLADDVPKQLRTETPPPPVFIP